MRFGRPWLVHLAAVVLAAGCGVPVDGEATELDNIRPDYRSSTTVVAVSTLPSDGESRGFVGVIAYFVRDEKLVGRASVLPSTFTVGDLLDLLALGPRETDRESGVRSGLDSRRDLIENWSLSGRNLTVELAPSLGELPGSEQLFVIGQVTLTLTANLPVDGVYYQQAGNPVAVPGAAGQPLTGLVRRSDYSGLLS